MTKKLSIPLVVLMSAIILSIAMVTYLAPLQIAKGGETACPKLQAARDNLFAKDPNHPGIPGLDRAIANNCPVVGNDNCAQDFGLGGEFPSQCYSDTQACSDGGAFACLEPSVTCDSSYGGAKPVCGIFLPS